MDIVLMLWGFIAGVIITCIWYEDVKRWWENRKTPYRWICSECKAKGNKYWCGASDVRALDAMTLQHKEEMHDARRDA